MSSVDLVRGRKLECFIWRFIISERCLISGWSSDIIWVQTLSLFLSLTLCSKVTAIRHRWIVKICLIIFIVSEWMYPNSFRPNQIGRREQGNVNTQKDKYSQRGSCCFVSFTVSAVIDSATGLVATARSVMNIEALRRLKPRTTAASSTTHSPRRWTHSNGKAVHRRHRSAAWNSLPRAEPTTQASPRIAFQAGTHHNNEH